MTIPKEVISGYLYYTEGIQRYTYNYFEYARDVITVYFSTKAGLFRKNVIKTQEFKFKRVNSSSSNDGEQSDGAIKFKEFLEGIGKSLKGPSKLNELEREALDKIKGGVKDDFAYGMLYVVGELKKED